MYKITKSFSMSSPGKQRIGLGQIQVMYSRNMFRQCFFFGKKPQTQMKRFQHGSTLQTAAILSKENRTRCMSVLQALKPNGPQSVNQSKKAAVLIPLCMVNKQLSLLYTLRSTNLKTYRGQVSFPGGMNDNSDRNLEETATRETFEELGIKREQIDLWGHGSYVSTVRNDMKVMPYVGFVGEVNVKKLTVNNAEVESVFTVPLAHLCNPTHFKYTHFRGSHVLPVFTAHEPRIWGMTAMITHIFLGALLPGQYRHKLMYMQPVKVKEKGRR